MILPEEKPDSLTKIDRAPITVHELIRGQLDGKGRALERYDAILWKIRSGYVVVLYGAITIILGGNESKIVDIFSGRGRIDALFYLTLGLSLSVFFIDLGFLMSKLRVVEARNNLADYAVELVTRKDLNDKEARDKEETRLHALLHKEEVAKDATRLKELLHLSGEAATLPSWRIVVNGSWSIVLLYSATPALLLVLQRYAGT